MTEIDNSFIILTIDTALEEFCKKFTQMDSAKASTSDEFWYLVLSTTKEYLREYEKNSKHKILYKRYIDWFISEWPPKKNKKGNYMLSKYIPPPEVILSQLD